MNQNKIWDDDSSELTSISRSQTSIREVYNILSNNENLDSIDERAVRDYIYDLNKIKNSTNLLSSNSDKYFKGKNTFCSLIQEAIYDLFTVIDVLNHIRDVDFDVHALRQKYDCFKECIMHLEQSLQLFLIDTS